MEREQPEKARLKAEAFSSDVTFIIVTVTKSRGFRGFFSSPPIPPRLSMPNGPWLHVDGQHGRMAPLSHIAPVTNKRGRCHGRSVPLLRTAVAAAIVHSATAFSLLPLVAVGSAIPSCLCGRAEGPTDISRDGCRDGKSSNNCGEQHTV